MTRFEFFAICFAPSRCSMKKSNGNFQFSHLNALFSDSKQTREEILFLDERLFPFGTDVGEVHQSSFVCTSIASLVQTSQNRTFSSLQARFYKNLR